MEELEKYNNSIVGLYNKGFSFNFICDYLYNKVNTRLKIFNKKSNGVLWISVPKISKVQCQGHVYNVIFKYLILKNGGN